MVPRPRRLGMVFALIATVIAAAWAGLLGTAYVTRVGLRLPTRTCIAALCACYLLFAALALFRLGTGGRGWLAAAGLLVPYTMALSLLILAA